MLQWIYVWLPRFFGCHCRPDRSFHFKGRQFPICARCTGELVGFLMCFVMYWFWRPSLWLSVLMLFPLIIDGGVQKLTNYESTNTRRFITGVLFAIGLFTLFTASLMWSFGYGVSLGHVIFDK